MAEARLSARTQSGRASPAPLSTVGAPMRLPAVLAVTAVTASLATPATAAPIDHGRVHDVETEVFTCESNGLPVRQDTDVVTTFMFNLRGSSPFPYLKENVHGTTTWTNLRNGGTFTNVFSSNYHDVKTTDNGDGTYTLDVYGQGGSRYYDNAGNFVYMDPAASGSGSSSTTAALPVTPRTTPRSPSTCSASPPDAPTPTVGTSATTC